MVRPINLGIIGLGWVARDFMLPAIVRAGADRVILKAVVSKRPEDFRGLGPQTLRYTELEPCLAEVELDAVYIATPNHLHQRQAIACLAAGIHVLCEKPLAPTYAEVETMRAAALEYDRLLITAFDQRHHPAHRRMREFVRSGRLGTPTQARIDYACWLPREWSGDNWRIDPVRAGGGAIIDLAPHGLDLLEFLLDDRITELHCFDQAKVQDYSVDDGGILTARFASGTLASQTVAYNRPETLPRRRLELIGTGGMLLAENTMGQDPGGRLTFTDAAMGETSILAFDAGGSPFYYQLLSFLDRIAENPHNNADLDRALALTRLLPYGRGLPPPAAPPAPPAAPPAPPGVQEGRGKPYPYSGDGMDYVDVLNND